MSSKPSDIAEWHDGTKTIKTRSDIHIKKIRNLFDGTRNQTKNEKKEGNEIIFCLTFGKENLTITYICCDLFSCINISQCSANNSVNSNISTSKHFWAWPKVTLTHQQIHLIVGGYFYCTKYWKMWKESFHFKLNRAHHSCLTSMPLNYYYVFLYLLFAQLANFSFQSNLI